MIKEKTEHGEFIILYQDPKDIDDAVKRYIERADKLSDEALIEHFNTLNWMYSMYHETYYGYESLASMFISDWCDLHKVNYCKEIHDDKECEPFTDNQCKFMWKAIHTAKASNDYFAFICAYLTRLQILLAKREISIDYMSSVPKRWLDNEEFSPGLTSTYYWSDG